MSKTIYEDGDDPLIIEARNRIPEPSRVNATTIVVGISYHRYTSHYVGFNYNFEKPKPAALERIRFHKHKLSFGKDCSFYAWVCERDGKIYL